MNINNNKKNIPQMRFKDFDGEWEEKRFGEIANIERGLTYKPDNIRSKGVRVLRSSNINEDVFQINEDDVYVEENAINISEVTEGDILITAANGSNRLVGKHAIINNLNCKTVHGGFMLVAKPLINSSFLNSSMSSFWYRKFLNQYVAGGNGAIGNLSKTDLDCQFLKLPSPAEQSKIGALFSSIDLLIASTQKEHDKLVALKKCMLQKMFPKKGSLVPEIRFKGFEGEWVETKFSDLYIKVTEKNDYTFDIDKAISVATMYFKSDVIITNREYLLSYNIMRLGDIAFEGNKSKDFAHGRFVENDIGDGIVSHVFEVFRPIDLKKMNIQFWKYYINNESVMHDVLVRSTKSSTMMTNLVPKDFLKESILVPSLSEQQKIGSYFQNLDNLISKQSQELEKLKNIKKTMLSKMFV